VSGWLAGGLLSTTKLVSLQGAGVQPSLPHRYLVRLSWIVLMMAQAAQEVMLAVRLLFHH
jgi:hypothetical protein